MEFFMSIIKNNKFEIFTEYGWNDFEGISYNGKKLGRRITFVDNTSISATYEHPFNVYGEKVICETLKEGDSLETFDKQLLEIKSIEENVEVSAYDILAVDNKDTTFYASKIKTNNCDELAFVHRRIALEFWTSIFPTLSCIVGGTYVLNPQDGYRRIDSYMEEVTDNYKKGDYYKLCNERIWGMDGVENVSHLYISPETDTLKITTLSGYKVEVTLNHPLYVEGRGMIAAKELRIGEDRIRYDIGMRCFGKSTLNGEFDVREVLSTDMCLTLDEVSTFRLISKIFASTDYIEIPNASDSLYRLKLILANFGFLSSINYERSSLFLSDYHDVPYVGYDIIDNIESGVADITYDFTVPSSHSFLQNGLMGSNTGGRCIITSTPTDDETLFADIWKQAERTFDENGIENPDGVGINGFKALRIKWDAHPERDESFKIMSIKQFGEEKFQREHELEFVSEAETLLSPLFLKGMEAVDPIYTTSNSVRWFKEPEKDLMYFISLDPSMGTGGDYAAIQVFEFPSLIQVAEWMHNRSDPSVQIRMLIGILNGFRDAGFSEDNVWWTFENNGCGDSINMYLREVEDETEIFGTLIKEPFKAGKKRPRKGMLTTNMSKKTAFARMKLWIEKGLMKINSKPLIKQFKTFVRSGATYRAMLGEYDDLVLAVMLIARMVEKAMGEEEEFVESFGVAKDIMRMMSSGDDEDDEGGGSYFPLPVG